MHTCPLVSALAKSFFTPTLLTFLSSISSTILCTLISPSLSIVYLPLFLYQSFYLISPPPINYPQPSPSFVRSLALFLSLSPGGLSLSLSLTPSLSFSLSLSLSLCMVRLFCGFDFLSDFLPLELLQSSLSPSTSLPHPLPLSLSLSLISLLPCSLTLARSLSLSNVRLFVRGLVFDYSHTHASTHACTL
jgi:hypothetical protein